MQKYSAALFKGDNRAVFVDRREFDGPVYDQIEEAYQFVLKHINLGATIDGIVRKNIFRHAVWRIDNRAGDGRTLENPQCLHRRSFQPNGDY